MEGVGHVIQEGEVKIGKQKDNKGRAGTHRGKKKI